MSTETLTESRFSEAPQKPISMNGVAGKRKPTAQRIFDDMRKKIADVFPDEDIAAWSWTDEKYETHDIERPSHDCNEWSAEKLVKSDEFSQLFTKRMFMVWDELNKDGFQANDKELWDHQKALFAWTALNITTGNREEMAKLLLRSPYGSGKSLVTGLITRAFKDAQLELLHINKVEPSELPSGAQIFVKKEHMAQNANGDQYSVLQPPYNVERTDINQYWRDMNARHGEVFSKVFPQPKKGKAAFYSIFRAEDDEVTTSVEDRIAAYLETAEVTLETNEETSNMIAELTDLAEGKLVFLPDVENNVIPHPAQQREATNGEVRFKGDSAHALEQLEDYYIATSHKSLSLDPAKYTTVPNEDEPAQFALVYGAALTRQYDRIRKDLQAFAKRCKAIFMDEAGRLNPYTVGDSVAQHSGALPITIGVTGYDKGVEGWSRSPTISEERMIELGLMKPIAYVGIGDPENPPSPGTEEAWKSYEEEHFSDYETSEKLGINQPLDSDTVICAKGDNVHEYAKRIQLAYAERDIPVEVFVYHTDVRDRKSSLLNAFKAPKADGDPKRILVATNTLIAEAHTIPNAEVYDVVDPMTPYMMDQLRGRLGHVRNLKGTDTERENARTVIRELFLHKGKDPYVRAIAKKFGFAEDVSEDNATWPPMQIMISAAKYLADKARKGMGKAKEIMDAPKVWRRKKKTQGGVEEKVGSPLGHINPHSKLIADKRADQQKRRLAKRAKREVEETARINREIRQQETEALSGHLANTPTELEIFEAACIEKNVTELECEDLGINPTQPTMAIPGSEDKIAYMAARHAAGLPLWHPKDRRDYEMDPGFPAVLDSKLENSFEESLPEELDDGSEDEQ